MSPPAPGQKQKGTKRRERQRSAAAPRANGRKPAAGGSRARTTASPGQVAARKAQAEPAAHPTVELARQLAAIVETHSLSELVVDTPDLTLTLRRGEWAGTAATAMSPMAMAAPMSVALPAGAPAAHRAELEAAGGAPPAAAAPAAAAAAAEADSGHVVTSPFVGTFYRSPNPDSEAYVSEGQRVEKGQVLCIVEAMKLMNEIEADQAGVIAAILVQNGDAVEYGQALFRITPP